MKKLLKHFSNFRRVSSAAKGFTLIELLVVIGILGILASALVATIDPFEQLKKAQDANFKNIAVEYVNANIRYFTNHNYLPWADSGNTAFWSTCSTEAGSATAPSARPLISMTAGCVGALINENEIKAGFTSVTQALSSIYVSGATNGVTACFVPQSKSGKADPNAKWTQAGVADPTCPNVSVATCYWCSQ